MRADYGMGSRYQSPEFCRRKRSGRSIQKLFPDIFPMRSLQPGKFSCLPWSIVLLSLGAAQLAAQDSSAAKPKGTTGKWSASVTTLSGSNMHGAADLRVEARNDKESRARLSVRSVPINRQLAWDVVAGSCGDEGRPVAAAAAFRVLLTRNDGGGETLANVPKLASGQRYYVRVYAQGEAVTDRTAFGCANLSEVP